MVRSARRHLAMKNFVKKSLKLDRKKFNGEQLVHKIRRKRKRKTNSFQYLRGSARRAVRKYFNHKTDELPVVTKYANGGLFKRSNNKLVLYVKQGRRTLDKYTLKKSSKPLIDSTNSHNCVDEMILFLHQLPDAIIDNKPLELYSESNGVHLTYQIK